jgi:uncharacterized protein
MSVYTRSLLFAALAWFASAALAEPQFPALTGRVVDQAEILSPAEEQALTQALAAHEQATTNQVVVATIKDLQGYDIQDFAYQLGRHWGIGQKGKDNGVLLLVAPEERKTRIEVGYGLEGTLTDALSHRIIQDRMLPEFREGRMAAGIEAGTQAILKVLEQDSETLEQLRATDQNAENVDQAIPAMFFVFIVLQFVRALFRNKAVMFGASLLGIPLFWGILGSLLGALVLWVVLAMLLLLFSAGGGGGSGGRSHGRSGSSSTGFSSGGFSSGGFSGGGGSFGGGGASGSW